MTRVTHSSTVAVALAAWVEALAAGGVSLVRT